MKIVIAQDSSEGLEQVGIYKDGKLAYQYDTFECEPPSIVEVLDRLEIDVQVKDIDEDWFYRYAESSFPRILKDVKWKK